MYTKQPSVDIVVPRSIDGGREATCANHRDDEQGSKPRASHYFDQLG